MSYQFLFLVVLQKILRELLKQRIYMLLEPESWSTRVEDYQLYGIHISNKSMNYQILHNMISWTNFNKISLEPNQIAYYIWKNI